MVMLKMLNDICYLDDNDDDEFPLKEIMFSYKLICSVNSGNSM